MNLDNTNVACNKILEVLKKSSNCDTRTQQDLSDILDSDCQKKELNPLIALQEQYRNLSIALGVIISIFVLGIVLWSSAKSWIKKRKKIKKQREEATLNPSRVQFHRDTGAIITTGRGNINYGITE